ncbi:CHASE2 domain-containing protein [Geomonas sp. RF6]|uniref:CHASE2 domain-containing protein n=1 Tax=Geomonas sp. RF6 TaxID=2897342 RepID=UPI001E2BC7F6|nr:CHASE2 domain-containing protein [Geomonas sp. RF6]UFS69327.1 CHASE2 domain-containing protein [Geomonas sp. RF6]
MPEPFYSKGRITRFLLLVALLVTALTSVVYLARPSFIVPTENRTTDLIMLLADAQPSQESVEIVDIDESSLERYGQWPWSRALLAQLLDKLEGAGARTIALDIILAETERNSPLRQGEIQAPSHELRASTTISPGNDQTLANTLAKGHTVLGYEFLFDRGEVTPGRCELHPPPIVWVKSPKLFGRKPELFQADDVVCNHPLFSGAVKRSGFLNAAPDSDGILRRVPMLIKYGEHIYPSLELAALMQYQGSRQLEIVQRGSSDSMTLKVGSRSIRVDSQGNMIVRFHARSAPRPSISAEALLRDEIPPETLRKKIVVVGSSAAGLEPTYQTFAGKIRTHVEIHAQVLDNLLSGRQPVRTSNFLLWEILVGAIAAAGTALAVANSGVIASGSISLAILMATWLGMGFIFEEEGYLFSPLLPTVLIILNFATLTIAKGWKVELVARKVADRALVLLKESEKNLASIIKAVPDIIFSLDRSCNFLFISDAVERYGVAAKALLGREILPFIRKSHRDRFLRTVADAFREGAGNIEFQAVRMKSRQVWFDTHMVPLRDDAGAIVALLGIARDVTEKKETEQALAEKQHELEELNADLEARIEEAIGDMRQKDQILILQGRQAAMGEMISNIAHQWRQPLNTLGLVVQELLIIHGTEFSRERLKGTVDQAMGIIMHMSKTIDDFRNYFMRDKEKKLFNVVESVQKTLSLIDPTLKSMGIEVELLAPAECLIPGYPNEYCQVLLNILLNSRDAFENSPPRGRLIRITVSEEKGHCIVTISDNAGGIAAEVLPKIFDPYFTTKGPDMGTGIGLYMAKTIIEKNMGGSLTARNAGDGAEFRIAV